MNIFLVDFLVSGHHVEYAVHLGRYFLEHGHEVSFWTWRPDNQSQALLDIGVNVRYMSTGRVALSSKTFYMVPQFRRGVRGCFTEAVKERADIVHLLYLDRAMPLPLWWNSWQSEVRAPICGTLFWPYHFIEHLDSNLLVRLYHKAVRKALKNLLVKGKLSILFVHTEHIKEIVLRALRLESLEARCVVVPDPLPDPIDMPGSAPSKQECRARLGLPQERIVLLFFGTLRADKGPDVLLKAAHLLPLEILVLFAGSPMKSLPLDWEQEVRTRGLHGRVRLDLGHVPNELVDVYLRAADAIVLPYRRSFLGTSGVLQRAAGTQKPVIGTDVGEIGNLVRRYGLGVVAEPEDPRQLASAIEQYIREREVIEANVRERSPLYISQNHWRRTGSSILETYESIVSGLCPMPAADTKR